MLRLVYSILILKIMSASIFFPLGKMIGVVWLQTNFILSSLAWEISNLPTGSATRMNVSCAAMSNAHACVLQNDSSPQCEQCQGASTCCHILVEYNRLAQTIQT